MAIEFVMISGKQGVGKSTITRELIHFYSKKPDWFAFEIRFAKVLYDLHDRVMEVMKLYGFKTPTKDGLLLQFLGTEWGRFRFGEDVWVDATKNWVEDMIRARKDIKFNGDTPENMLFVISDCRFKNEFAAFPQALRVRLECPEEIRETRAESWRDNTQHPSEIDLDEYSKAGKFDLYLKTDTTSIADCRDLIRAQLDKKSWMEKRK